MRPGLDAGPRKAVLCQRVPFLGPHPDVGENLILTLRREAEAAWVAPGVAGLWEVESVEQRVASSSSPVAAPPRGEIPLCHFEIVRRVLEFIQRRPLDGTSLTAIAGAAGVSRSHLCRIFKRITGSPLKWFLTHHRLQIAKAMLHESGVPIHQVAWAVGYRDLGHFDRVFRQWGEQTPSSYRRQAIMRGMTW